ncbi:hypothetical protein CPELA_08660 [Corynebacterium pelargi]|uniref:Uncharacterized protein n=1 Tax=Corynebacterium pelargi TaxID=1471400 RepID=A0A410WAK9_9CORY|nr:hypothetical protein CPELA_08635 [Corynebacterium pelargi]QAU52987.1 hypothetical protein CPELA_08660 [Corynebacterium pelargi]
MKNAWLVFLLALVVFFANWAMYRNGVFSENVKDSINLLLIVGCASYGFFRKK